MKATVLYDLGSEVEIDEEDMQVFSMVNRRTDDEVLTDRVIVETADGMYVIPKPTKKHLFFRVLGWIWIALLAAVVVGALILSLLTVCLPGAVPFWATVCGGLLLGSSVAVFEKLNY